MKQHALAALFTQLADLLEFQGANPFRIRAYRKAAQNLESLSEDIEQLDQQERLRDIPGIGEDLSSKIHEYLTTGKIHELNRLKRTVPPGVLDLMTVPSVGPKTTKLLYERLHITSVAQLERAARDHRLQTLPGFQQKKEENILKGIDVVKRGQARMDVGRALALARSLMTVLRKTSAVKRVEIAGSLRRMKETIGDLDLLVSTTNPGKVAAVLTGTSFCSRVLAAGKTKVSILTSDAVQVDVRMVEPECFGAAWQYFTGSKEHNVHLRELAVRQGLKVNEYGVFRVKTGTRLGGREEVDVYRTLGLPWIPPELREDTGELEAAAAGRLPQLVEEKHLKGDFHIHTNWSDGQHTLEAVAQAGFKRGYQYLAICDHSPSLKVAHGLSIPRLKDQISRIARLNKRFRNYQLLVGAEVDILERGRLDYPDDMLRRLDFVVASIHSGFKQDEATITNRIVTAMRNPYVTMIAHPTGRLLGQRDPYAVDLEQVFRVAADTQTALEINAYPKRLDLNDTAARRAKELGVMLGISTDTHRLDQLETIALGVAVARRAWAGPAHVLNCLTRPQLLAWIRRKRAHNT